MAAGLERRVSRVETAWRRLDPWNGPVGDWIVLVKGLPYANWLFRICSRRPALVAKYLGAGAEDRQTVAAFESEWRRAREVIWKGAFWSRESTETSQGGVYRYFQNADDPALPSIEQSEKDFGLLLATVPPLAFVWARRFDAEQMRMPEVLRRTEGVKAETAYSFLYCERQAAESMTKHGRLAFPEFEQTIRDRQPALAIHKGATSRGRPVLINGKWTVE